MTYSKKSSIVLAIETSCDDTSVALTKNNKLLGEVTKTSLNEHRKFGGIVPEIAARSHESCISLCLDELIKKTKIKYSDITHIAYTDQPGLPGSLHIGKVFAKSIAYLTKAKLIPINHMYGHIFSFGIDLNSKKNLFPFLCLVASGGHTSIYLVRSSKSIKLLNQTGDDAVGETLDKIGRVLGLEYPGGISIDNAFNEDMAILKFINHYPVSAQFSFSGLKTSVLNYINSMKMKKKKIDTTSVASSVLEWIVDELIRKIGYYCKKYKVTNVVIGGGVSANKRLRAKLLKTKYNIFLPKLKYCGDNASMIANYANLIINNCFLNSSSFIIK